MKVLKKMLFILLILIVLSLIIVLVAFSILSSKSNKILDDYSKIYTNQKFTRSNPVLILQIYDTK